VVEQDSDEDLLSCAAICSGHPAGLARRGPRLRRAPPRIQPPRPTDVIAAVEEWEPRVSLDVEVVIGLTGEETVAHSPRSSPTPPPERTTPRELRQGAVHDRGHAARGGRHRPAAAGVPRLGAGRRQPRGLADRRDRPDGRRAHRDASDVPDAIFSAFGQNVYGLPQGSGAKATTTSFWTARDNLGYSAPAGTQVAYRVSGDTLIVFETTEDLVIPAGSTTVSAVAARGHRGRHRLERRPDRSSGARRRPVLGGLRGNHHGLRRGRGRRERHRLP
jgi:hypothetical protein